ncbi:unnamed protein product [Rotaria magnacalcarata]|uniref:Uncharacterized protein n=4 Tax=Rotaria magnacalcarata TaxID=392030 RepID=A0A816GZ12_9BILA|nr:unnamed protein product [Rotaria magnacalcarata]CAF4705139.1 unnamed protein product [Rotaria magnacalcarata]
MEKKKEKKARLFHLLVLIAQHEETLEKLCNDMDKIDKHSSLELHEMKTKIEDLKAKLTKDKQKQDQALEYLTDADEESFKEKQQFRFINCLYCFTKMKEN